MKYLFASIKVLNLDWAHWDDAYIFLQNKNKAFIESNINPVTFENSRINLILFFDKNNQFLYGQNYDLVKKETLPVPSELIKLLQNEKGFLSIHTEKKTKTGIFNTPNGFLFVSVAPILTSQAKGPAEGTLLMGYYFDNRYIEKLSELINMKVQFFPFPLHNPSPVVQRAYKKLTAGKNIISAHSIKN